MKGTRSGMAAVFLFLVGIPVIVDIIMPLAAPREQAGGFGCTRFMLSGCIGMLPFYFAYRLSLLFRRWIIKEFYEPYKKEE